MVELALSITESYIGSLLNGGSNKSDLFHVVSEARALRLALDEVKKLLLRDQQKEELVNNEQGRQWLSKVKKMAYDAEDVVDTFISETELPTNNLSLGLNKIYWAHHTSKELHKLRMNMKDIKVKLEESNRVYNENSNQGKERTSVSSEEGEKESIISSENENVEFDNAELTVERSLISKNEVVESNNAELTVEGSFSKRISLSFNGHRQPDDDFVVGINNDVEDMVKKLTILDNGKVLTEDDDPDVISIVGMGGSGKTTLARNIYNHPKVHKHFKYRVWVTLSRGWKTSDVIDIISGQLINNKSLLVESVSAYCNLARKLLSMQTCLIVFDNVWDWKFLEELLKKVQGETLKDLFKHQDYRTKFVITSRQLLDPSNKSLKWCFHEMKLLKEEVDWDLFNKVTSSEHGKELAKEFRGLAIEMLSKCEGLPLAIVALGKLLKTKDTIQGWESVFSQLVRKQGPNDLYLPVNQILALSYHNLHYSLKPCFLYFGLFSADYPIKGETLIRMWIVEGFVQRKTSEGVAIETLEDAARQLLQQLIDHNMVQVVKRTSSGKVKRLRVLRMMRDICIKEAKELDFLAASSSESYQVIQKNSRRAAVNLSKCTTALQLENSHLRTLFLHEHEGDGKPDDIINGKKPSDSLKISNQLANLNLADVFVKLKFLRILDINGIKTFNGVMPKEIGNLIHLQYLRIRSTNISELPKSIGKLRKLLTLDYWNVNVDSNGIKLPNVLWKLSCLRHLYLPYEMSYAKETFKLDTLKDLQILWGVRGGKWMLKQMENLNSNLKKLCIQGISNHDQIESLFDSPVIKTYDSLYSLALDWYGFVLEGSIIEKLSTKENLKKVKLMGQAPDQPNKPLKFPNNLTKLELYYTHLKEPKSLEALGELKCLKFLRLAKDSFIGCEWDISSDALFQALEVLKLSNLPNLETWEMAKGAMPCLTKLTIISCSKLKQIPQELALIRKPILKIERMPIDFNSAVENVKELKANTFMAQIFDIPRRGSHAVINIIVKLWNVLTYFLVNFLKAPRVILCWVIGIIIGFFGIFLKAPTYTRAILHWGIGIFIGFLRTFLVAPVLQKLPFTKK